MFNVDQFVNNCKGKPASAVKDLMEEALRDPAGVKQALDSIAAGRDISVAAGRDISEGSIGDIFRSPALTVLKVAVPPKLKSPPHNHRMWAVIGVYDGQENNTFYRRSGNGLEQAGGRDLKTSDVVVLGEDAIHAVENPLDRVSCAIHVYGGDLPEMPGRSIWNPFTFEEHPYDFKLLMDYARQLMVQ